MKKKRNSLVVLVAALVLVLGFSTVSYCHDTALDGNAAISINMGFENYQPAVGESEKSSDIYVDSVELEFTGERGAFAGVALLLYEEDDFGEGELTLDEAFIKHTCPETGNNITLGKLYIPFADGPTDFIVDPLVHDLGETRESVIEISAGFSMVNIAIGAFNGDSDEMNQEDKIDDFYAALEVAPHLGDSIELSLKVAYLSDITDSDADLLGSDESAEATPAESLVNAPAEGDDTTGDTTADHAVLGYSERVGGISATLAASSDHCSLTVEYVTAQDDMIDYSELKPTALNVELATEVVAPVLLALKYETSEDFVSIGGDTNVDRMGLLVGYGLNDNTEVKLELLRTEDDSDNKIDSVTVHVAYTFKAEGAEEGGE